MDKEQQRQATLKEITTIFAEMDNHAQAMMPLLTKGRQLVDELANSGLDLGADFDKLIDSQKKNFSELLNRLKDATERLNNLNS